MMPPSLEILDLSAPRYEPHKFTGGIPTEWGSLTKLKELRVEAVQLELAADERRLARALLLRMHRRPLRLLKPPVRRRPPSQRRPSSSPPPARSAICTFDIPGGPPAVPF